MFFSLNSLDIIKANIQISCSITFCLLLKWHQWIKECYIPIHILNKILKCMIDENMLK